MTDLPLVDAASTVTRVTADKHTPEQVRALAVQFESILLAQMLKNMRDSVFEGSEESSGIGAGPLGDSLFQEFSIALSRSGRQAPPRTARSWG